MFYLTTLTIGNRRWSMNEYGGMILRGENRRISKTCYGVLWSPPSLLFSGYRWFILPWIMRPGREADHPHLVPSLRLSETVHSHIRLHGVVKDCSTFDLKTEAESAGETL